MKRLTFLIYLLLPLQALCQLLSTRPYIVQDSSSSIRIYCNAAFGNQGLLNYTPTTDVYVHIGAITTKSTSSSDWLYVPFLWASTNPAAQCSYVGNNVWSYTIQENLRSFFGITDTSEHILDIAILFRNGAGTQVERNRDGSDMYLPVEDNGLHVRILKPYRQPTYVPVPEPLSLQPGDSLPVLMASTQPASLSLAFNGSSIATASAADTLSATAAVYQAGNQTLQAQASTGSSSTSDSLSFYVSGPSTFKALPTGVSEGINQLPGDTSVTLVLYAPHKTKIQVIGDFNNWTLEPAYQMYETPDSLYYWLTVSGLKPAQPYTYQYVIDDSLRVADYNAHLILDPNNDSQIPASTYPNIPPYPQGKTTGIASVLETGQTPFAWTDQSFQRPDKHNLLIYELLVRDFTAAHNFQGVLDSLSYLKALGVNAIEVMPFNEFEGNDSWGYNPDFYFAPDKAYGTAQNIKTFINACHRDSIAVIMDMVLNHSFGSSPMVQMYWDGKDLHPAADNPWFNEYPTHPDNVGYQFNHESPATKTFTYRVMQYWLNQYHLDGFRFDLAKGFTQTESCDSTGNNCSMSVWGAYDSSRVAIWDTIYDQQQRLSPGSYCILEMFADNSEEKVEAARGMLLWGNMNYAFNQATMGYSTGWDFSGALASERGWSEPNLVSYMESHDEERMMYKNEQYGNASGSYIVKDTATGLARNGMAAAFWALMPGPKMLWQFGELGYDYSINTCSDGSVDNTGGCRLTDKPIRWDYEQNPERWALHQTYARLLHLRELPAFKGTFTATVPSYNFSGAVKTMTLTSDSLDVVVAGNFDVQAHQATLSFPHSGTWYDYLSDSAWVLSTASLGVNLAPGGYHVWLDRHVGGSVAGDTTKVLPPGSLAGNLNLWPNPLQGGQSLQLSYHLNRPGQVVVQLLDLQGRRLGTLLDQYQQAGDHNAQALMPANLHASGMYILRILSPDSDTHKKLIFVPNNM